ncbi:MAG: helix-turn-helix domain-containing protein [Elusimicrobia bacterium]|nr:helix-turn-helix domain-containing protein [Elusimicrobiota bacterium]
MKAEKNAWSVGLKIKEERKRRGLTQRDLADATGLSEQFISNLERGQRHPGTKTLRAIAGVLKMQPAELFSGMSSTHNPLDPVLAKLGSILKDASPEDRDRVVDVARSLVRPKKRR